MGYHKIWRCPEPLENAGKERHFWVKKISKNCLTKGTPSVMIVKLARAKAKEKSEANLENDTEKKRAIRKKTAKIPKSKTRKC